MAQPKRVSLAEFAEANKPKTGYACWLCNLPERAEVEAAAAAGVAKSTIQRWLRYECGYGELATESRVSRHLNNHVTQTAS